MDIGDPWHIKWEGHSLRIRCGGDDYDFLCVLGLRVGQVLQKKFLMDDSGKLSSSIDYLMLYNKIS